MQIKPANVPVFIKYYSLFLQIMRKEGVMIGLPASFNKAET